MLRILMLCLLACTSAAAQNSTITYQGQLRQAGAPFTGLANLDFRLFSALTGGSQIGAEQTRLNWPIEDGLFQTELDFGPAAFSGEPRFLEIRVNGAPLSPRQALRASPLALFALEGNAGPAGPAGPPGPTGASPFVLEQDGSIEYRTNIQIFRLALDNSSPRLIIGHPSNEALTRGSVISGGGSSGSPNRITAGNFGSIGGGLANLITGSESTIGGGHTNSATGQQSTVSGGFSNLSESAWSAVGGGFRNVASGRSSVVAGGDGNTASEVGSTVSGGNRNCAGGLFSWAGGSRAKVRPGSNSGALGLGCEGVPQSTGPSGDEGTYVWADRQLSDFVSSGSSQYLVRAQGGALFTDGSVNTPAGNRLRVDGTLRVDSLASSGSTQLCRNANNQLATCSSSARYKREIETLEPVDALIEGLRPVQYRWIDSGEADIGFVAEEVAELMPALVTRNESGDIEGVRYDRFAAVLVRAMQQQRAENAALRQDLARLADSQKAVEALARHAAALELRLATLEAALPPHHALTAAQ